MTTTETCEASQYWQEPCDSKLPATRRIKWVPPYQRGTARAAMTVRGVEETLHVCEECFAALVEWNDPWVDTGDGYAYGEEGR